MVANVGFLFAVHPTVDKDGVFSPVLDSITDNCDKKNLSTTFIVLGQLVDI